MIDKETLPHKMIYAYGMCLKSLAPYGTPN